MEQFIGTKIVQAEPHTMHRGARFGTDADGLITAEPVKEEGYKVRYEDGYESWSPKEVFEEAYRRTDGLNFGLALEAARMGKKIARKGWNGKGQYVELGESFHYISRGTDEQYARHMDIGSAALVFVGTRGRQVGWLASQADMLADDWYIVE